MEENIVNMEDELYGFVRYKAYTRFKIKPVRVRHLTEMMTDPTLDIRHSSPGLPWEPSYKTVADVFNTAAARYNILQFWTRARRLQVIPPFCLVLDPTDSQNAKSKIHPPYKYPVTMAIGEAQFALPLIQGYLKDNKTPMAYALGKATEGPWCLRSPLCPSEYYGNCSYGNLEESLRQDLVQTAFFVLRENLDFGAYEGWEIPNAENMQNQYLYTMTYFLYTPVCKNYEKNSIDSSHFPSGSYFTQLIDIMVYWMLVSYGYLKTVYDFPRNKQVFGDNLNEKTPTPK